MDVVVVKRRDCVIGSYTVLRTIHIAGMLAVLLACAGTEAGVTTRVVGGSGAGVDIDVTDRCVGNHGRDNTCQTTWNYNDDEATGRGEKCRGEAAVTVTAAAAETPVRTYASTWTFESILGSAAVFAIAGLILIFCCGRIDPTQAVKAAGFNPEDKREYKVFKPILYVPLCSLCVTRSCATDCLTSYPFHSGQSYRRMRGWQRPHSKPAEQRGKSESPGSGSTARIRML